MKKVATWGFWIAFGITFISWGIIGIKLTDGNYSFTVEAYIAAAGFFALFVCSLIKRFGSKCPHCGKAIFDGGTYCSYCGKKINDR